MSYENSVRQIAETYQLSNEAIDRQRTLLLNAQTRHLGALGIGYLPDDARNEFLQMCWRKSMEAQDYRSKRHPLADRRLEGYRMLGVATAAGFQVLGRLESVGIATTELETPQIYRAAWPILMSGDTFSPAGLIRPALEPVLAAS